MDTHTSGTWFLDRLRDPAVQFIGATAIAIVGIAIALLIYWLQRQTKELAFGPISSRRLLSIADELSSRVTVELDGKPVTNIHVVVFGLINSGHKAIAAEDFERPLTISFADATIVASSIYSQIPSNLNAALTSAQSSVTLEPLLLNSGDQLQIQLVVSARKLIDSADVRIRDVPSVSRLNRRETVVPFWKSPDSIIMLGFLLVMSLVPMYFGEFRAQSMWMFALFLYALLHASCIHLVDRYGSAARRRIKS